MVAMIELDIKIRAKNDENLKMLIEAMTDSLAVANSMGKVDVQFTAETDGDKMILIRKEIIIPSDPVKYTPIEVFLANSNLPIRIRNILDGTVGYEFEMSWKGEAVKEPPFKFVEDLTRINFLRLKNAGNKSWCQLKEELQRQNIKY